MTKQAPHVLALKAAFLSQFGFKLSVRSGAGSQRDCLLLSVAAFAEQQEIDRARLVDLGGWLERRGFYQCHDYGYQGLLSSPAGWTCWNGGVSVMVRYRESP
ncbi:hypothetical protein [Pseudomonas sp. NMI795_08]|uniref:hypothetical protein n=1 Tax=Pseudomonas sp. NMI795_08 TaxID=2903144 RepID=UPI001E3C94D9|nr:hypothetical protein [Pseudomonas sp. NMI795_08]MCE1119128.1 hypothetical protein [Pseudomonas sp. NMI795_08]